MITFFTFVTNNPVNHKVTLAAATRQFPRKLSSNGSKDIIMRDNFINL